MLRPDYRQLLLDALQRQEKPISAQALFAQLRQQGQSIGLATVYRILHHLRRQGLLSTHTCSRNQTLYSLAARHEHYLTCIQCGRRIRLPECPLKDWEKTLPLPEPFRILYHELQLFGLCQRCQTQ